MAVGEYKTVTAEAVGEIEEKKSRFIATMIPVSSEDAANEFILALKKKYWDARHNCWAYIILDEENNEQKRSSDDGEPSRTAGLPMLEVLEGENLKNIVVVVTRYFGGTLLGTGGLIRAYQGAVKEALSNARLAECIPMNIAEFTTDYNGYGRLQYFAVKREVVIENTDYSDVVKVTVCGKDAGLEGLITDMTEASAGACKIERLGKAYRLNPIK